jgi:hypothetical protein
VIQEVSAVSFLVPSTPLVANLVPIGGTRLAEITNP